MVGGGSGDSDLAGVSLDLLDLDLTGIQNYGLPTSHQGVPPLPASSGHHPDIQAPIKYCTVQYNKQREQVGQVEQGFLCSGLRCRITLGCLGTFPT